MTNDAAIEVSDLSKTLRRERVLEHVNLRAQAGEIVGITGPNGSGKTLLLRLLCGLATPTSGTVTTRGKVLTRGRFPKDTGVIIDAPSFLAHLTGLENLVVTPPEKEHTMDLLGLGFARHKRVRYYSLGMRQRLAVVQAIMEKPRILLLDEPTNGLDTAGVDQVLACSTYFEPKG